MKKTFISVLLVLIMVIVSSVSVFAHPDVVADGSQSTVSNLIKIKKPDTLSTSTVKTTYSITGTGSEGVSVCFYIFDGEDYEPYKNNDGSAAVVKIGSSGVFYRQISLKDGENRICVRAENANGDYQYAYITISVISSAAMTDINSFSLNMQSKLNGWLN